MISLIYNPVSPIDEFGLPYIGLTFAMLAVIAALAVGALLLIKKVIRQEKQKKLTDYENKEV